MKHKHLIWLLALLFSLPIAAQLPEKSSAQSPIWYYIQVEGDGDRTDRVFTCEESTKVAGRAMINTTDIQSVSTQLWRFEGEGSSYIMINRASEKSINLTYDSDREIGIATLSNQTPSAFELIPQGNSFQIKSQQSAIGGSPNDLFLHQANSGGNRDYCIMLVSETWADSENSLFSFVLFEDFSIDYSDNQHSYWYNIMSGHDELQAQVLTETTDTETPQPFILQNRVTDNHAQEWKIIKTEQGNIQFVNRSTGHNIATKSERHDSYNLTQKGEQANTGNGWSLTYLGNGQYSIKGIEEDSIERFLHASQSGITPEDIDTKASKNTRYAWMFKKIDDAMDLEESTANSIVITVEDGRIYVKDNPDFKLYGIKGNAIPNNTRLIPGVYFVTVGTKSTKVIVN